MSHTIRIDDLAKTMNRSYNGVMYRAAKVGANVVRGRVSAEEARRIINFWTDRKAFSAPEWLMDYYAEVSEKMAELGMNQRDIADVTGYSQRMVSYYFSGQSRPPIEFLEAVGKAVEESVILCLGADNV